MKFFKNIHRAYSTERHSHFDNCLNYFKKAITNHELNTWHYMNGVRVRIKWCSDLLQENKNLILPEQIQEAIEHLKKLEEITLFENIEISKFIEKFKTHLSTNQFDNNPKELDTTKEEVPRIEYQIPKVG